MKKIPADIRELRWHAIFSYASSLHDLKIPRLAKKDIIDFINFEKKTNQFSYAEQSTLKKIFWRMFYQFNEFEKDIKIALEYISEIENPPVEDHPIHDIAQESENPQPSPIIPDPSVQIEEIDQSEEDLSPREIEKRLEFARFLFVNGIEAKSKDEALFIVAMLLKSEEFKDQTLKQIKKENRENFKSTLVYLKNMKRFERVERHGR